MKTNLNLSKEARAKLEKMAGETGLKFNAIVERLILGKPVGNK